MLFCFYVCEYLTSVNTGVAACIRALELALDEDWPRESVVLLGVAEADPGVVVPAVPDAPGSNPGAVVPIMFM